MTDEELVAQLPETDRERNGIPDPETIRRRERAAAVVEAALRDLLLPGGLRTSPLGPGWSSDVDAHLRERPDDERLSGLGWIALDRLLTALGSPGRGRWAVVEDGEVLGTADLHASPPPDPVAAILGRSRRRREVRLRDVLELRELVRRGTVLPDDPVVRAAADAETALGGDLLSARRSGALSRPPVPLPGAFPRRMAKRILPRRARQVGLALSGVDGSGKSTVARLVLRDLARLGIPAEYVWTRPGMRISWLEPVARLAKRMLREDPAPGVIRVAADPNRSLRSRRGTLGRTWAALVTRSFVGDVRRRARAARGVVVYDRHLMDALVTLEFAYRGVDLSRQRRLVRRRMPAAALSFYLAAPAELAVARKPGDAIGEAAVRRQLEAYATELEAMPEIVVLDASRPPEDLARDVLAALFEGPRPDVSAGALPAPRRR